MADASGINSYILDFTLAKKQGLFMDDGPETKVKNL
jgi:hypothetical protein